MDDFPDFLGMGAGQSGSTWLHNCLAKHPNIFMPDKKELQYFSKYFHRPLNFYLNNFRIDSRPDYTIYGEICPDYSALNKKIIRYIYALNPELKIIYIIRNPIERTWSAVRRKNMEKLDPLQDEQILSIVKNQLERQYKKSTPYFNDYRRWDHIKNLDNWINCFGNRQLQILNFDDICAKQEQILTGLFHFLGVSIPPDYDQFELNIKVNKNFEKEMPKIVHDFLKRFFQDEITALKNTFGVDTSTWLERTH